MAKAKKQETETLNLDTILFKCRDILRQARNSGSFFEKRDMMLTLIFLRFIGEKYEDGIEKLRKDIQAQGLDPDDPQIQAAFFDDDTFTDGTYNLEPEARWTDYAVPPESNANYAWILHMLHHLKKQSGVAGFLLANGALGDSDAFEIRKKLIQNDKVEAIIVLPRELFITTDISVTVWILNNNKKGGSYHNRQLRKREGEILFMDLRTWRENPVKNEGKKKVILISRQIQKAAEIYHTWQNKGTDGLNYAVPELYRSVGIKEIEERNFSLVPSKYIEFVDRDLDIDYPKEMERIQKEMAELLTREEQSRAMLKEAFKGIGYGIE